MQIIFDRIASHGLTDWAVLLQGIKGIPGQSGDIPSSCIGDFANMELERIAIDDPLFNIVSNLAIDSSLPRYELALELEEICMSKNLDIQRGKRIWRAAALEEILANPDVEPLYGLIRLSEFWSDWGWPIDAPQSMRHNAAFMPEYKYHSIENYENIVREHEQWLEDELTILKFKDRTVRY